MSTSNPKAVWRPICTQGLLQQFKHFLIELGCDFCLVGSEFALKVGGRDFALDLLFFHRGSIAWRPSY